MLAITFLTLVLASCAHAAPGSHHTSCDISKAKIAYPKGQAPLPAPTAKPSYVAVAIGTQNYTCSSAGTYTIVGAVAELFDIGCLYNAPLFSNIADAAYQIWDAAPPILTAQTIISFLHATTTPAVLGQHYYVPNASGTGSSPKWDFTSQGTTNGNPDAYVVAAKSAGFVAPTGTKDVDWVLLKSVAGSLATEIYRVDTRGGQPPATCTPGTADIAVKYAAKYWLMGSSL
ncbi:hypothetical protein D9615_006059 [Tricholomella constricta]|uniref:Malate dehydrogenase n=1 Tax=Tricholomella constricta TaxID=117010 RepID=A0A8H5H9A4_9AGAR|nr:hypothetical protein D9615_006059 [Tricholomella constricta]